MKKICLTGMTCLLLGLCNAQVITRTSVKSQVPGNGVLGGQRFMKQLVLPHPQRLPQRAKGLLKEGVYKFAEPMPVNINLPQAAGSSNVNGYRLYCLRIRVPNAVSLSLDFENFNLPEGAEMYIYNPQGTVLTGPVTAEENKPSGFWGSDLYQGDAVVVEVKVPQEIAAAFTATITSVGYGFRALPAQAARFGDAGTCNINVACAQGAGWQTEQAAVALILDSQGGSWTGTLVNNTCGNRIPYVLTASHAATLASSQPVGKWRFIFQYKSPVCNPGMDGSQQLLFNGAQLRANSSWSDFALVEMDQMPPVNSGIVYAGWDRSGSQSPSGTTLHHPDGDVMKISHDAEAVLRTPYPGSTSPVYWQTDWNWGVTEVGSSGAALFNSERRIIGQLRGGYSYCGSSNLKDYFGAFDVSWAGSGTPATRLSDWLDPQKTAMVAVPPMPASHYSIAGPAQFCSTAVYSITNLPPGTVVNWMQPSPWGVVSMSVSGNQATLTRLADGVVTLRASITLCGRTLTFSSGEIRAGAFPMTLKALQTSCNTAEFTLSGNMPTATYSWTTGAGDVLFNGFAASAVTTVPSIAASGTNGTVAVSTTNSCGNNASYFADYMPYQRQIEYGMYQPLFNGDHIVASVEPSPFVTDYNWYLNGTLVQSGSSTYYNSSGSAQSSSLIECGYNTLSVTGVTSCGTYSLASDDHLERACLQVFKTADHDAAVAVYPNPASAFVTLSLAAEKWKQQPEGLSCIREIRICDKLGSPVRVQRFDGRQRRVTVDTRSLQPGIYFIEVSDGIIKTRKTLSIR